jgi:hypothetical protein
VTVNAAAKYPCAGLSCSVPLFTAQGRPNTPASWQAPATVPGGTRKMTRNRWPLPPAIVLDSSVPVRSSTA